MDFYIIVSAGFAAQMTGKVSEVFSNSVFGYAVTADGRHVCSINSANDFPAEFAAYAATLEGGTLPVVPLGIDDFPKPVKP